MALTAIKPWGDGCTLSWDGIVFHACFICASIVAGKLSATFIW